MAEGMFVEPDARLIAAAPDLLAALENVWAHIGPADWNTADPVWSAARAAIVKATTP